MTVKIRFLLVAAVVCGCAWAQDTVTHPFSGVTCARHEQKTPEPLAYFLVRIDLANPKIRFVTTKPNGDAPRDTHTQTTLDFVKETGAQLGINANYFTFDGDENTDLLGLAVSEGVVVSPWDNSGASCAVNIGKDNKVTFVGRPAERGIETAPPVSLFNAVAGRYWLVKDGKAVPEPGGERHPRTAIGRSAANELLLLIVDGRSQDHSVGMTIPELAEAIKTMGAVEAIALDGGGSATLVLADPTPHVANVPMPREAPAGMAAGPPGIPRENGNNLAVFAAPAQGAAP